jgi:hypothetical protein
VTRANRLAEDVAAIGGKKAKPLISWRSRQDARHGALLESAAAAGHGEAMTQTFQQSPAAKTGDAAGQRWTRRITNVVRGGYLSFTIEVGHQLFRIAGAGCGSLRNRLFYRVNILVD